MLHRPAGALAEPGHQVLDHIRNPRVERVDRFPGLEIDVGVLGGAADEWPLGGQRPSAMCPDQFLGHQCPQVVVGERLDGVDFVGGSESVEEVHERYPGRKRGRLRDERQVVGLLHRGRPEQREPRLPHRHHVGMVAEDRQSLRCNRSGRHVDDSRGQFTGDLVHVRDHQQQALRRGEGRGQRAALQGAVQSARRSTLALHFDHRRDGAPHIGPLRAGPFVGQLGHRRRRRDRVDAAHLVEPVGDRDGSLVAVHRGAGHVGSGNISMAWTGH